MRACNEPELGYFPDSVSGPAERNQFTMATANDIRKGMAINYNGDIAVVFSVQRVRAGFGEVSSFRARFLRVWLKRDGRWQLVAHEATRLP